MSARASIITYSGSLTRRIRHRVRANFRRFAPVWVRLRVARVLTRNPITYNEHVRHKLVRDFRPVLSEVADKFEARSYVADRLGADVLVPLLGAWAPGQPIDWAALPSNVVLKPNHASSALITRSEFAQHGQSMQAVSPAWRRHVIHPDRFDERIAERQLWLWCDHFYGIVPRLEFAYWAIPPRIIAEPLLTHVVRGATLPVAKLAVTILNGEVGELFMGQCDTQFRPDPAPFRVLGSEWDGRSELNGYAASLVARAVEYSRVLAADFEQIRVDWHITEDSLWFSELTHYPSAGRLRFFAHAKLTEHEIDVRLGEMWPEVDYDQLNQVAGLTAGFRPRAPRRRFGIGTRRP